MAPSDNSTESSDRLLSYLEHRAGRSLRSRQAIDQYVDTLGVSPSGAAAALRDPSLRITAGVSVLALMFLFYYFMDVGVQISSLHSAVLTPATISSPFDHRQDRGERARSGVKTDLPS
ncbi:MAG TPA: hypothetical protein VLX30_01700 [Burkholderiales bacterium]|nr:hypothetical protein [Burkholderiales bacterium]